MQVSSGVVTAAGEIPKATERGFRARFIARRPSKVVSGYILAYAVPFVNIVGSTSPVVAAEVEKYGIEHKYHCRNHNDKL